MHTLNALHDYKKNVRSFPIHDKTNKSILCSHSHATSKQPTCAKGSNSAYDASYKGLIHEQHC